MFLMTRQYVVMSST